MKLTSLILPMLLGASVVAWLVVDKNPSTDIDTIPAAALDDHIAAGTASIDNSFATYPLSQAIVNAYLQAHDNVDIRFSQNGNTDGFSKFCRAEVSMIASSRPILTEEISICNTREVRYIEVPLALDATVIVTNKTNPINNIEGPELIHIWEDNPPNVNNWHQANPHWSDRRMDIFGPSFTAGETMQFKYSLWNDLNHRMREDYTQLRTYPEIISNISTNRNAISFMSYTQYLQESNNIKILTVNGVAATPENISNSTYPFTHYLFLYLNPDSIVNPEILEFVQYYMEEIPRITEEFGYIPLNESTYETYNNRIDHNITGTAFLGRLQSGINQEALLIKPLCCGRTYTEEPLLPEIGN